MHCIIVHPLMHYFFYLYETDLIYNDLNLEDIFQFVTKNVKISFFANLTFFARFNMYSNDMCMFRYTYHL